MGFSLFITFFSSLSVSIITVPLIANISRRLDLFDQPGERKIHTRSISRLGGISIFLGMVGPIIFFVPFDRAVLAFLGGLVLIFTMGVWDDLSNVSFREKFAIQILASVLVVIYGGITLEHFPLLNDYAVPGWILSIVTIIFFVGVTNAVNLLDGLDGLAGGVSFLSFGGFAYLGWLEGDIRVMVIAIALMGGIYGFLRFNAFPARVFMGDGGSQVLGFSLATLAILITRMSEGAYPFVLSLLILGLPILDTVGVMMQRCVEGRLPFLPDTRHIHHKLMTAMISHKGTVILIYLVQSMMLSVGLALRSEAEWVIGWAYACFAIPISILFLLSACELMSWCRLKKDPFQHALKGISGWLRAKKCLEEKPFQMLQGALLLFLTVSVFPFIVLDISSEMSVIALILFGLLFFGMTVMKTTAPFLIRLSVYIGTTFVIYLNTQVIASQLEEVQTSTNIFFLLLGFLVIISGIIEFGEENAFHVTSIDYLIIIGIFISTFLGIEVAGVKVGLFVAKLAIFLIAFELVVHRFSSRIFRFGFVVLWILFVIGVRGWGL